MMQAILVGSQRLAAFKNPISYQVETVMLIRKSGS